ncbi:hypothetical protein N658DRAFT_430202 [Parathielavia hyrcaniae]|uniref:F-box domain-containing protein n=1 Tax=Parathielavia hyrcaniae TaxID=113614 RepID=A0AAN6Q1M8_9PEZI|nr:hypothetical protein N658DRAFT_430202 [Parathielavia hyrcaniae]
MDFLPVELVRLVFQYCDATTVRALRQVSARYADVGYEFLLDPHFTAVEWRDDITTLGSIAGHDRLRGSIRSLTFNFCKIDEYSVRHTNFEHWPEEPEERSALLQDAWLRYYELEEAARKLPPFDSRSAALEEAFKRLPNLKDLEITFTKCPYDIPIFKQVFQIRSCCKRDRLQACKNMNAIVSAIRQVRLASLSIDQLPLEIFRLADDRRHWFDCARSFATLSRLSLALDFPPSLLPSARFRAVNGLGHVLQYSANLTHLTLAFHNYQKPLEKFHLSFHALFNCGQAADAAAAAVYPRLTDLKLENVSCAEDDLRAFLLRHGATLERLRLGGRGLARPHKWSMGGVHLHEGSFRGLFAGLRGRMPRLRRFHMEGDFHAGKYRLNTREIYRFLPVTDDEWEPVVACLAGATRKNARGTCPTMVDCLGLERYLVEGGEYPRLGEDDVETD